MNTTTKILMALGLAVVSTSGWAKTVPEIPADGQETGSGTGAGTQTETWDENGQPTQPNTNPATVPTPAETTPESPAPDDKGTIGTDKKRPVKKGSSESELRDAPSDPMSPADRTLTDKVNKGFKADKALATGIKNVKVSSLNGQVTLKGHVATEAEKASIEKAALAIAGTDRVINNLKVKSGKMKMTKEEMLRHEEMNRQGEKASPTDWHRAK